MFAASGKPINTQTIPRQLLLLTDIEYIRTRQTYDRHQLSSSCQGETRTILVLTATLGGLLSRRLGMSRMGHIRLLLSQYFQGPRSLSFTSLVTPFIRMNKAPPSAASSTQPKRNPIPTYRRFARVRGNHTPNQDQHLRSTSCEEAAKGAHRSLGGPPHAAIAAPRPHILRRPHDAHPLEGGRPWHMSCAAHFV